MLHWKGKATDLNAYLASTLIIIRYLPLGTDTLGDRSTWPTSETSTLPQLLVSTLEPDEADELRFSNARND